MGVAESAEPRLAPRAEGLRERTARGTLVNAGFRVGIAGLALLQRLLVAIFLTPTELGIWGIVVITLITFLFFKNEGIADKFVQQSEGDQEREFQRAFTFELGLTLGLSALAAALLPVFALAYGQPSIVAPGLVLLLAVVGNSFQAPAWIFYRRMDFVRQRSLEAVDPATTFVVTIALAAAGAGYWSLVVGAVVGSFGGALAALRASPYRLRIRVDRGSAREYLRFSWPLFLARFAGIFVAMGSVLVGAHAVGVAGVGAITLAASIMAFADGVDAIVTQTIYPAICAVVDRLELLRESFVKSNRLALMWGVPFGLGLALFADDLVRFVIGEDWSPAIPVLRAFGIIAALDQLGFNWTAFLRARNDTRPLAMVGVATIVGFGAITVPLLLTEGLRGYAIGMVATTAVTVLARTYFLGRLFSDFSMLLHAARAVAPSVPAVAAVLAIRAVGGGGLAIVIVELLAYVAVTVSATVVFERELLRELVGYLRRRSEAAPASAEARYVG